MFKRRALDTTEDLLQGERRVYEAIHKLTAARTKSHTLLLKWASGENSLIFSLLKRLAEIQWIYNEATKEMADKHLELSKAFKRIFQKEKQLDELRKELQGSESKKAKLQKQIDGASKKSDHIKAQSLEADLTSQITVCEHLTSSNESKTQKLEAYKLTQLKKALVCQAEGVITLSGHCQQLYASQMQLIDLLPDSPLESTERKNEVEHAMSSVIGKVSELLNTHPPPCGGIEAENSEKPHLFPTGGLLKRHKSAESLHSVDLKPDPTREVNRPEVNYTQGMYCEIVIPDQLAGSEAPKVHIRGGVPMRRSQSGSSPVVSKKVLIEKHRSAIIPGQNHDHSEGPCNGMPLNTDWETNSTLDTSSDDLEPEKGYSHLTIVSSPIPNSPRSSSVSPDIDACNGYARPVDVVPFEPSNYRDQLRKTRRNAPTSPPIPEGRPVTTSDYETIEDIRKLKNQQRIEANRLKGVQNENKNHQNEEPVYSRPFDAVSFNQPLKVSVDSTRNQVGVTPKAGGKFLEKAARSLHQTSPRESCENLSTSSADSTRSSSGSAPSIRRVNYSSSEPLITPPAPPKTQPDRSGEFGTSEEDQMFFARTGSAGSLRSFPLPPKPVAAKTRKLRTGQATVITSGDTRKPTPKPRPTRQ